MTFQSNKIIGALLFSFCLMACTSEDRTKETLRKAGYTEIETTGYAFFECGEDDDFHTAFRAKNPRGEVVTGAVCCGWMKSCTIRF